MQRLVLFLVVISLLGVMTACTMFDGDKVYISDTQYATAQRVYNETGSVRLTAAKLKEFHWRSGEINEAIYRLTKQYEMTSPNTLQK
jgi:hypothetical protein